jgi:NADH:ubiquinone oxidoreductase subunit 2 (subunit N)
MLTSIYFSTFINKIILISAAFSALVGGVIGLNQTQLRALLAYSSIGHVG